MPSKVMFISCFIAFYTCILYIALVVELGFSLGRYLVGALMEHFLEGSSPLRLRKVSSETLKKQFVFVILLITNILICE